MKKELKNLWKKDEKKIRVRSRVYWNCLCDCGNMKSVRQDSLISGKIKTCTKCNTISKIPKFLEE